MISKPWIQASFRYRLGIVLVSLWYTTFREFSKKNPLEIGGFSPNFCRSRFFGDPRLKSRCTWIAKTWL